jgi:methionyl-tRNA formyltransferase
MSNPTTPVRVLFFGTPHFAATALEGLLGNPSYSVVAVVTQPDRRAGRGKKLTPSPVKSLALKHDLPVFQPGRLKKEWKEFLSSLSPLGLIDIGVVVAFGQILPKEILSFPSHGCVNVHASLLPRWRGAAPIQRAILAGDTETGICLMDMDEGLDTGGIYVSHSIPIGENENCESLHNRLAETGASLLSQRLGAIATGEITPTPQPDEGVTYAQKIDKSESCIPWTEESREIQRAIRAFSPFPGAFSFLGSLRVKVLEARIESEGGSPGSPGEIIRVRDEGITVCCGSGSIVLKVIQPAGKRPMPVSDFLRGASVQPSMMFSAEKDSCN